MHPRDLSILDFQYTLPEERIARYPLAQRDQSKLLVYRNGHWYDRIYQELPAELSPDSILVFNNTRVVEARILFKKDTGGQVEIFCLEPDDRYPDITTAMMQTNEVWWNCLVGGAKKWKEGALTLHYMDGNTQFTLTANKFKQHTETYCIHFQWNQPNTAFAEVLHKAGLMPLPPYLNRMAEETDKERYQTIYAQNDGSVAAPTAGLHFTDTLIQALREKNIRDTYVTLHVGAGTFKPVKALRMQDHEMHAEFIDVTREFIKTILATLDQPIITVGTTSLRTVESLYWLGVKTLEQPLVSIQELTVSQWDPYENMAAAGYSAEVALKALVRWMEQHQQERLITKTQIIIAPGYRFRIIKGLITNFHQPQSTLLLLVAAIVGDDWKKIYSHALKNDYRFLSYGDGCLLWLPQ